MKKLIGVFPFPESFHAILVKSFVLSLYLQFANSQYYKQLTPCGVLYSEENYNGEEFTVNDREQSVNVYEDTYASEFGWNYTGSLKVTNGCEMQICDNTYFDGNCEIHASGTYPQYPVPSTTPNSGNLSSTSVASVKCQCKKECKCSDIFMKKSTCARAYLKGGCSTCHTLYADLKDEKDFFTEEFAEKVESLVLRKGCKLTVWEEEDFGGTPQIITDQIVEEFTDIIGSYSCTCNDAEYVPRVKTPPPVSYPPLIDIPPSVNEVMHLLSNQSYSDHPGLRAALKSLKNRRSSKNAYILLLGVTGAGKSSAINMLFDSPITEIGGVDSTTTDIHEFRVPVPVEEIGVANSELRVIDTPGFGDTRGIEQDAKMLATLDFYLSTHEELKDRIPNIVLVVDRFTNNRFSGEGSQFVKMLRGYDSFRERLTDENFSNVIFVLTHFFSESKDLRRRPDKKISQFKDVIANYSLFPKPIMITVAENKARQQDLPMVNGFYKLPNNEFYPKNLFEKMTAVTEKGGDLIGMGVISTAFRDSDGFNISHETTTLLKNNGTKVQHYLKILAGAALGVNNTEVSQLLNTVWEQQIDPNLRKRFPMSLFYLQKVLNIRNIHTKDDIPRTTTSILELLSNLKHDEATRLLLDIALNIKAPSFPQSAIAGHSYNVFKDTHLAASPFKLGNVQISDIGFMIPKVLTCNVESAAKEHFEIFENQQKYLEHRIHSLGIGGTISLANFTGTTKPGHNIKGISFTNDSCTLSASREFRLFEFILNDKKDLAPEFENSVKELPTYNEADHAVVSKWKEFFNEYGTHVVNKIYGGGSINIQINRNQMCTKELGQALFDLIKFAENFDDIITDSNNETSSSSRKLLNEKISHSLKFSGGDISYHTNDLTSMSIDEASTLLTNWKKSLKRNPALLTTEMRLLPISEVVKNIGGRGQGQNYSDEIARVTNLLFNSELVYIQPPRRSSGSIGNPGLAREDTPYLNEVLKMQQESNQKIFEMMMMLQNKTAENEIRRQAMEERRFVIEQQRAEEEKQWRRDAENRRLEMEERRIEQELLSKKLEAEQNREFQLQLETMRAAENAKNRREEELRRELENERNEKANKCKHGIFSGLHCVFGG